MDGKDIDVEAEDAELAPAGLGSVGEVVGGHLVLVIEQYRRCRYD